MASSRFVSPGVFTRETDLTFVAQQVGVTTLGLVGETLKGPAFEPIFISDYEEFSSLFGGQHPKKFGNDIPQYELPYIARQYLSQSNQLFVTRILGLTGYDAGSAWVLSASANIDPSTSGSTGSVTWTANFTGTTYGDFTDVNAEALYNLGLFANAPDIGVGNSFDAPDDVENYPLGAVFTKTTPTDFVGNSTDVVVTSYISSASTGSVSGTVVTYSGTSYTDVEGMQIGLIRSRGDVDISSGELSFRTYQSGTGLVMGGTATETDPLADFTLSAYTDSALSAFTDYSVSLDRTSRNFLPRVIGSTCNDKETALWTEELSTNLLDDLIANDKIYGINSSLTHFGTFGNYKQAYQTPETPWIVSELRGNVVDKLFKFVSITDGTAGNQEIKISIVNIRPDTKQFDVVVRDFNDTDARPLIIERFSKVTMEPTDTNFIAQRIGTADGEFELRSRYIMLVMNTNAPTDGFPAGFEGYKVRTYGSGVIAPKMLYKTEYDATKEKVKKVYLGISNTVGIDTTMLNWRGQESDGSPWGDETTGFHMDSGAAIAGDFEVGADEFRTAAGIEGTSYDNIFSRKFTLTPYCGFDGWNCYRDIRTNSDRYRVGSVGYTNGVNELEFLSTSNPDLGTSDYYAYLAGINTFDNPEAVNINVFATPGIDYSTNTSLVAEAVEMIEEDRSDSLYILTSPEGVTTGEEDLEGKGFSSADITTPDDIVDLLDIADIDSNYTATYWPWVQERDTENNVNIWLPPTLEVLRNIALTDNISFPWFAVAGYSRGTTNAIQARVKLTESDRDVLYDGRINPMATFSDQGVVIWGNKNLQIKDTALNRINIRRLLLQARKLISAVAVRLLFEQNDQIVRNQFLNSVNPILDNIRRERGLVDFRVVVSDDPEEIDRREMTGRIFLKPIPTLEFIELEFVVTPTGASFDDI